jgi:UDP-N-acetylglucosamine 1-carboxyvinyltransferase
MEKLHITGGKPLSGSVQIAGAKNAASKMIIATLLTAEPVTLHNIPLQQESDIAKELIEMIGAATKLDGHTLTAQTPVIKNASSMALTRKNRLSILLAAPLMHRGGEAVIPLVEGDKIGPRPVNYHVQALERMGAKVEAREDGWHFTCEGKLKGVQIELPYPSVGATETVLFAGVLAKGKTVIQNAAVEPEILELVSMLQKMGADIEFGAGRTVIINGVEALHGCEHTVLPDRLEAASYACIALATRGEVFCRGAVQRDMINFLNAVRKIGGNYEVKEDGILFAGAPTYRPTVIETDTFPGFSTDWQQPFAVVLTQASGESKIHETVMSDRFKYTETLNTMGANIRLEYLPDEVAGQFKHQNYQQSAIISGPSALKATTMTVPDIRAGLAYVAAALAAEGTSEIDGLDHLERGYEDLYGKLKSIGAQIVTE